MPWHRWAMQISRTAQILHDVFTTAFRPTAPWTRPEIVLPRLTAQG